MTKFVTAVGWAFIVIVTLGAFEFINVRFLVGPNTTEPCAKYAKEQK